MGFGHRHVVRMSFKDLMVSFGDLCLSPEDVSVRIDLFVMDEGEIMIQGCSL